MTSPRPIALPTPHELSVKTMLNQPVCVRDPIWTDAGENRPAWLRSATRSLPLAPTARLGGDAWSIATRGDEALVLIADARGSGEAASPIARTILTVFRTLTKNTRCWDPKDVIAALDDTVRQAGDEEDFVTALVAHVRGPELVDIVSAGHPPPVLIRRGGVHPVQVDASPPLGLTPSPRRTSVTLAPRDRLFLFTDGVSEASDDKGNFFAPELHLDVLGCADLDVVLDALLGRLLNHTGGALRDDATLLLLEADTRFRAA